MLANHSLLDGFLGGATAFSFFSTIGIIKSYIKRAGGSKSGGSWKFFMVLSDRRQ